MCAYRGKNLGFLTDPKFYQSPMFVKLMLNAEWSKTGLCDSLQITSSFKIYLWVNPGLRNSDY